MTEKRPALVAITRGGAKNGHRLARLWPGSQLFVLKPEQMEADGEATLLPAPFRDHIAWLLGNFNPICFFCAVGIVVRLIAPHLRSKQEDPAVLAVDEAARFVVSVVSGHRGGANDHAQRISGLLNALPVITTASDAVGTLPVDLLGRALGWRLEADPEILTRAAAAVVNGDPVALVQECGSRGWQEAFSPWPKNVHRLSEVPWRDGDAFAALLWITRRPDWEILRDKWRGAMVVYRPPPGQGAPLAVGLGCDRGTGLETLEMALNQALKAHYLRGEDIRWLATIDRKRDEVGLLALAQKRGMALTFYPAPQLAQVPVPSPSETVRRHLGTPSVSEAAALLVVGEGAALLVEKSRYCGQDGKNATVAIAWRPPRETTGMAIL